MAKLVNSQKQLEEILQIVSKRPYYSTAKVRAALLRDEKGIRLIGGHVTVSDQATEDPSKLDYEAMILVELSMPLPEFQKWISQIVVDEKGQFGDFEIPTKGQFMHRADLTQQIIPSNSLAHSTWACNVFRYYLDNTIVSQPPSFLPTKADLPLYPDSRTALAGWLGTNPMMGEYSGSLVAFLPNMDGRLGTITLSPNRIGISVVPGRRSTSEFKGKVFAQEAFDAAKPLRSITKDMQFPDAQTEVDLEFKPGMIYAVLFDKEDKVVDHQRIYTAWPGVQGVEFEVSLENIERIIEQGESDTLEFKTEIGKNHRELAETMVAFANSRGGLILLGVGDDGDIKGVPIADLEKIEERMINFSRELCEPPIEFKTTNLDVREHTVVVIEVKSGSAKPYWLKNKGPIIRRGSTDRIMTRYELAQLQTA